MRPDAERQDAPGGPVSPDRSIAGEIARALAARIVNGEIAPGTRLRQDHLAVEFAASHVPVREAFRRLEAQGLVASAPRKGVWVPALEPREIIEVTEMRATLETLGLRLAAAAGHSAEDVTTAEMAIDAAEASTDIRVWEDENRRFHTALVAACDMPRLLRSITDLQAVSARFLFAAWQGLNWQARSEDEHRAILAALRKDDPETAGAILSEHIRAAGQALCSALDAASR